MCYYLVLFRLACIDGRLLNFSPFSLSGLLHLARKLVLETNFVFYGYTLLEFSLHEKLRFPECD